jgi:Alw26I/Eco31I/Esp3I family type II restriction m6 adenine DNA methyltransferase
MLNFILEDLKLLFQMDEIPEGEIERVLGQLKSEEVKAYINHLRGGSKPEVALREAFFAGRSILSKYLATEISPEVSLGDGFIDYKIGSDGRFIFLELKSLFEAEVVQVKTGRELKGLKQRPLKWEDHMEQVLKYIRRGGEYIVLTNLKEWCFFNDECGPDRCEPFYITELFSFLNDFEISPNLYERLERYDLESIREGLDKRFFESLKAWVKKLSEVEFDVDEKRKLELIIGLINRFVFIQTLDDYGVIGFRWIKNRWDDAVQSWAAKGKLKVLTEFFRQVTEWFYEYYDTELFKEDILKYVRQDNANIDLLYRSLELVLGLAYWQTPLGGFKGIMQYNFKFINEDIFGKAYETFLAEVRKEQGIFYTPRYVTEYIVENTVGRIFNELLQQIKKELEAENFEAVPPLIERFKSIRVLDPACGSGSFLIKAVRKIFEKYKDLKVLVKNYLYKYERFDGSLVIPKEVEDKAVKVMRIYEDIQEGSDRELISKILVRHIHGNDLDIKALDVAKVNLWLEAIKLASQEFRFDKLPTDTNHVLPNLEMNLVTGDSLIGLPDSEAISTIGENSKRLIITLSEKLQRYLAQPTNPEIVEEIKKLKSVIRSNLSSKFENYANKFGLTSNPSISGKALHWPLEFWFVFFDSDGDPLPTQERGFDIIIGNPPYEILLGKEAKSDRDLLRALSSYFGNVFTTAEGEMNLYKLFVERSLGLVRGNGIFSMIFPTTILSDKSTAKLRNLVLSNSTEVSVIYFPEKVRVFEEVTQAVNIFVIRKKEGKQPSSVGFCYIKNTFEKEHIPSEHVKIPITIIQRLGLIPIICDDLELNIFEKMVLGFQHLSSLLESQRVRIYEGEIHLTRFKQCLRKNRSDGCEVLIRGDNVHPYFVELAPGNKPDWIDVVCAHKIQDLSKGKFAYRSHKRLVYKQVMNIDLPQRLVAGPIDENIFVGNTCGFLASTNSYSIELMLAFFNSALWNWYFKRISSNNHILVKDLERMPLPEIKAPEQAIMEDQVHRLVDLKRIQHKLISEWQKASILLKNHELTLKDLLLRDLRLTRQGRFRENFVIRTDFYPEDLPQEYREIESFISSSEGVEIFWRESGVVVKLRNNSKEASKEWKLDKDHFIRLRGKMKEYLDFEVIGADRSPLLDIYGVTTDGDLELVHYMEFSDRDLMLHVYACLTKTLSSGLRVKTLDSLFEKTLVPIVKGAEPYWNVLTANIIRKVRNEIPEGNDLVCIDNTIRRLEAKINSGVFRLFKLGRDEAEYIIRSLGLSPTLRMSVFAEFQEKIAESS